MGASIPEADIAALERDARQVRQVVELIQDSELEDILGGTIEVVEAVFLLRLVRANVADGDIPSIGQPGDPGVGETTRAVNQLKEALRGDLRRFEIGQQATAGEDIFTEGIEASRDGVTMRVTVALDTATTFAGNVEFGGDSTANDFNEGNALGAGQYFAFDLPNLAQDATVNYQTGADAIANLISVAELEAGTT